jgi:hypothetical protein
VNKKDIKTHLQKIHTSQYSRQNQQKNYHRTNIYNLNSKKDNSSYITMCSGGSTTRETTQTGYQERTTPYGRRKLHYTQKTSKSHVRERFLDRSLKEILNILTHVLSGTHLIYLYWHTILYCVDLPYWLALTQNGSVGSSDCLLSIIVTTPEDGRHEGPKHVV